MTRLYAPELLESETVGIVLVNHLGSSESQDSGRDAEHLAEYFGLATAAVTRPGSGVRLPSRNVRHDLEKDYAAAFEQTWDDVLDTFQEDFPSVERFVIVGRSAGALGALALALNARESASAVFAAEGIAWSKTSVEKGRDAYNKNTDYQKILLAQDKESARERLVHPEHHGLSVGPALMRLGAMAVSIPIDTYHNKNVWASDIGKQLAMTIARDMPDTGLYLDFSRNGHTDMSVVTRLSRSIPTERRLGNPIRDQAPVRISITDNTVHSSYDLRTYFEERATPAVTFALQQAA